MEFDLKKMSETLTMISQGIHVTFINMEHNHRCMLDVKFDTTGIQFETIPDDLTGMFRFKCLIMKSMR
jgi:hypothetical protein